MHGTQVGILPTGRNTTYGADTPVKSADLNDLQDMVIGKKCGPTVRSSLPLLTSPGTWSYYTTDGIVVSGVAGNAAYFAVPCEEGDRITGFKVTASGNGVVDCTLELYVTDIGGTDTLLGIVIDTNHSGVPSQVSLTGPFIPHVIAAGERLKFRALHNAANYFVYAYHTTYDRL